MNLKLAIQPDEVIHHNGERQSYSERWVQLAHEHGIKVIPVDVYSRDVIKQISECDAFMWRYDPPAFPRLYARRLLYTVETTLHLPVFPALSSSWHVEDKIAQAYFFSAAGIPSPITEVFWTHQAAAEFCASASYPFVIKLSTGYQSSNVRLVRNRDEALFYADQLFGSGMMSLGYLPASGPRLFLRRIRSAFKMLRRQDNYDTTIESELQQGYFLAQEFLPGNAFDVRITIIGNRAFGFRRFNRPGDFRASGSGRVDWNPKEIDIRVVRLAFEVARRSDAQTIAVDVIRRGNDPVIVELNLTYASWAIRECPGHWTLDGDPESGELKWVDGSMRPEDAIFTDFVGSLLQERVEA